MIFYKKTTRQGTFVNLCYTIENHAIATMMTYFGPTDRRLGTEVDRGGTSSKNRLESPLIYVYIYIYIFEGHLMDKEYFSFFSFFLSIYL